MSIQGKTSYGNKVCLENGVVTVEVGNPSCLEKMGIFLRETEKCLNNPMQASMYMSTTVAVGIATGLMVGSPLGLAVGFIAGNIAAAKFVTSAYENYEQRLRQREDLVGSHSFVAEGKFMSGLRSALRSLSPNSLRQTCELTQLIIEATTTPQR